MIYLLSGFCFVVISCLEKHGTCIDRFFNIVGIQSIELLKVVPKQVPVLLDKDTIHADSLIFKVTFLDELIVNSSTFNFIPTTYATPPCRPPETNWILDSIRIFEVSEFEEKEVTSDFCYRNMPIDNQNDSFLIELNKFIRSIPLELQFKLIKAPTRTKTYQFKFQFIDDKMAIFEMKCKPVTILGQ